MANKKKFATEDDFTDLQEDLDECLSGELTNCRVEPEWTGEGEDNVDIADLFIQLVKSKLGDDQWFYHLRSVRIPRLRMIANMAGSFGLENLAKMIRNHIALRKYYRERPRIIAGNVRSTEKLLGRVTHANFKDELEKRHIATRRHIGSR